MTDIHCRTCSSTAVWLDAVLHAEEFPTCKPDLDTSLADVDAGCFNCELLPPSPPAAAVSTSNQRAAMAGGKWVTVAPTRTVTPDLVAVMATADEASRSNEDGLVSG